MGDIGDPTFQPSTRATLPVANPTKSFWQTSHPNEFVNERTTPGLPETADVVIVGSGVTAAFAARELFKQNPKLNVVVLEARTTCSGATGRNGGHCQPIIHEATPDVIDFELQNFREIEKLISDNNIQCDWRRLKGCMAFWNKTYFEESKEELEHQRKTDPRHLKLVKVVESNWGLAAWRLKHSAGAIEQSTAATLSPYKLVIWLWANMLKEYSLNLQTTTPVSAIERVKDGYSCHTERGVVHAKNILLATNGYTSHLLPDFEKLIRPVQGQMSALEVPESFSDQILTHSYGFMGTGKKDRVMSDYLHQRPTVPGDYLNMGGGGHLMFGGARECVAGLGEGVSDDSYVDPDAEDYLTKLPQYLDLTSGDKDGIVVSKDTTLSLAASWTGIMGYSVDHIPWVGGVPQLEGLWLCGGYTGHGMTNAAGCAQHVARLIAASIDGKDWHDVQARAVEQCAIPKQYILTQDRVDRQFANAAKA